MLDDARLQRVELAGVRAGQVSLVEQDSPWSWEFVDSCEGQLSASSDEGWTVGYLSGGGTNPAGTDPAGIERLAEPGRRVDARHRASAEVASACRGWAGC